MMKSTLRAGRIVAAIALVVVTSGCMGSMNFSGIGAGFGAMLGGY